MTQRLGDLLIQRGLITEAHLTTALRTQEFFGGHLGSILLDLGFLEEQSLGETLSRAAGVRYAPSEFLEDVPEEVIKVLPSKIAEKHKAIPLRIQQKRLHLVMLDPKDLVCLDEIAYITGMVVIPYVAPEFRIYEALGRYYGVQKLRADRITLSGKVDPASLLRIDTDPPSQRSATPPPKAPAGPGEVGLDGLPLDAEVDPTDTPFAQPPKSPTTDVLLDQMPRSLSEWRESPPQAPGPLQHPPPISGPADRTPVSHYTPPPVQAIPAPPQAPTPTPSSEEDPLSEASERLLSAETREEIAEILLNFVGKFFRRRLLFFFQRDRIVGWDGWGDQVSRERVKNVLLPMESLSLFTSLKEGGRPFRGPVADLPANRRLFEDLGMSAPSEVVLVPIVLKERVVSVIYGDNGTDPLGKVELDLLGRLSVQAAISLEILILRNKMNSV